MAAMPYATHRHRRSDARWALLVLMLAVAIGLFLVKPLSGGESPTTVCGTACSQGVG